MHHVRIALGLIGLLLLAGLVAPISAADASVVTAMVIPVKAAKGPPVCKAVVRCAGCKPVYRCRSCRKRPICTPGVCIYRTMCGWGPALRSLPKGARLVRVR